MVKRLVCFFIFCVFYVQFAAADAADLSEGGYWLFGIQAGWAHNTAYQGGVTALGTEDVAGNGPAAGFAVRFMPLNWIGAQFDSIYIQKNYGTKRNLSNYPTYQSETINHFFDAALLLNLSLPINETGFRVFGDVGAYVGYWFYSREKGQEETPSQGGVYTYNEEYEFQDRDNRLDLGLAFGGGIQYDWPMLSVYIEWRMYYAFSDLRKKDMFKENDTPFEIPFKNDTWTICVGVLINSNIFTR